jgi:hypothetical protein
MTDAELCARLRITRATLRNYLRFGPPRGRHHDAGDVRTILHLTVGGQRRWVRESVEEFVRGKQGT